MRDEWGFEMYYSLAMTQWMLLSPDLQVIGPSQKKQILSTQPLALKNLPTETVLGFRLQLVL